MQVALDVHCVLKDSGLKNNGSESTLYFSKSEIYQWKWLIYFKLGTDQALPLDQNLCQGVVSLLQLEFDEINYFFFL